MLRTIILCTLVCFFESTFSFGQESIKLSQFKKELSSGSKIKVINFWATWCAPCVKELPLFEKLNQENKEVDVLLVSMDYDLDPNPEKVKRFIDRKKLRSKVVILAEANPTDWIDKIDKDWSGALPATLIINPQSGKRKLVEGEMKDGELDKLIDNLK
jgi:thiol-disulfide isomerase/thioredoxin